MAASFEFEGFDNFEKSLSELDLITQKKVMRKAVRIGMEPVLQQVKAQISSRWGEKSGVLKDSVALRTSAPNKKSWADMIASVGVFRRPSLEELARAYYKNGYIGAPTLAYWFEYGVQAHSLGKKARAKRGKGQDAGAMHDGIAAKPVLRPVMDANVDLVNIRLANVLGNEIDKAMRK